MTKIAILAAAAAVLATAPAAAAVTGGNLLTNGSFENGLNGWTLTNSESSSGTGAALPVVIAYNQASAYPTGAYGEAIPADSSAANPGYDAVGTHGLYFVSDFANPQTLSQSVSLLANHRYTFGFDVYKPRNGDANPGDAQFSASLGGTNFASFTASALPVATWQTYASTTTLVANQSGAFRFDFRTSQMPSKDFVIDRVYLTDMGAVPEPATWAMMILGMGMVGAASRRSRRLPATVAA